MSLSSERLHRLGLGYFVAAILAGAAGVVVPEIEHRLAEMVDDIAAIEVDVFHECAAIVAIEDDVLMLTGRAAPFHHDADRLGRTDRGVRHIRRDEESLALSDEVIDDAIAFADADFDVALELEKIFLRIDEMKIVPGVWSFDDHDEKIAAIVEVAVADRRLEELAVRFDPAVEIYRWLDFRCAVSFW